MAHSVDSNDLPDTLIAGQPMHVSPPDCLHAARISRRSAFGNRVLTAIHRLTVGLAEGVAVRVDTDVVLDLGHACRSAARGREPAHPLAQGIAVIVGRALAAGTELGFYPAAGDAARIGARVTLVDEGRSLSVAPLAAMPMPALRA